MVGDCWVVICKVSKDWDLRKGKICTFAACACIYTLTRLLILIENHLILKETHWRGRRRGTKPSVFIGARGDSFAVH